MTEIEAQRKWCPFSRVSLITAAGGAAAANRNLRGALMHQAETYGPNSANCIGTQCMAWRRSAFDNNRGSCGLVSGEGEA